jgi:NodT family efflux transporter outer membrane factor (OMF) lipoprotein
MHVVWIFICLVLSSCGRHCYRAYPYSLARTDVCKNIQEAVDKGVVAQTTHYPKEWWVWFEDPQLNHLIEMALACHPDIHIADTRIRRAFQEARVARSALFPHLFGIVDVQRKKISALGEGFVPGLPTLFTETTLKLTSAVYELDIWQKNHSLFYASLDKMQAALAEFEQARLLLATTLAGVYFDLQMHMVRKKVTEERLIARRELYHLLKQQFDLGIISEFRLYEVDSEVQWLRDLIHALEGEIAIDRHALVALVGDVGSLCSEQVKLDEMPAAQFKALLPLPSTLCIDLLARRPDIVAQKWRVEAACLDIHAAKADFFPRIDLLSWLGVQSIQIDKLFRGETLLSLGEGMTTLPLFLAGKLQARLGIAREDLEIAIESYNQALLNAVQEVSDALSDLQTAMERKKTVAHSLKDARELFDLTQQKYDGGVINKLTLLNAVENVLVQQDLEVRIELERFEAAVDLIRATGGGYHAVCP